MPTYEYECKTCDMIFEVFQSISAEKLKECPTCGSPVKRLIGTGSGVVFKGTGFYETDFKSKKGTKPVTKPASSSVKSETTSAQNGSESKSKTSGSTDVSKKASSAPAT